MSIAILCSGQGHQNAHMFDLVANAPSAAPLFRTATRLLSVDPRIFIKNASHDELTQNRTAQILCTLQALALRSALGDVLPAQRIIAGYSVGELSAWSIAEVLDPVEALELAAARAEEMNLASGPDEGLLFLRGLPQSRVAELSQDAGVEISIVNPGNSFVVGGEKASLLKLEERAHLEGAVRISYLDVHVASHTSRLTAASKGFRLTLEKTNMAPTLPRGVRLIGGLDGHPIVDIVEGRNKLAQQISRTVEWAACLEGCVEAGADVFLETGPGTALAKMAVEVMPRARARSASEFKTMEGLISWMNR